ncbi:MAG: helix-turn-helix domain-containing protein [Candidatus Paceibacterota bacterium]
MDEQLLTSLGLNEREIKLYRAVLGAKELTPIELAKNAGIKRTTAYSAARSLVEKGLLIEDSSRRPKVFRPSMPEDINITIETERKRSEERQQILKQLSENVAVANQQVTYPIPRIKFIEGSKLEQYFKQAFPLWIQSMEDSGDYGLWGFQDSTLVDVFENQLHRWWKIVPAESEVYLLTNLSGGEKRFKGQYERRHMKYWGEATDFISSTWVAGDYMVIINTRTKPFYAIEIHSRPLAHDQREVFRNLWPLV